MPMILLMTFVFFVSVQAQTKLQSKCFKKMDAIFLVDGSGSINETTDWPRVKDFVSELSRGMMISQDEALVGLIVYSYHTHTVLTLGDAITEADTVQHVQAMPYKGYKTNTASGFEDARHMFEKRGRAITVRRKVGKVLVHITDGHPNKRIQETETQAQKLKDMGVTIINIGITVHVNETQLRSTASLHPTTKNALYQEYVGKPMVKQVEKFEQLKSILEDVKEYMCNVGDKKKKAVRPVITQKKTDNICSGGKRTVTEVATTTTTWEVDGCGTNECARLVSSKSSKSISYEGMEANADKKALKRDQCTENDHSSWWKNVDVCRS